MSYNVSKVLEEQLKESLSKGKYHYHPEAFKPSDKPSKVWNPHFIQGFMIYTCPYCGRSWEAVKRDKVTCGSQGGKKGCGFKSRRWM